MSGYAVYASTVSSNKNHVKICEDLVEAEIYAEAYKKIGIEFTF